MTDVNVLNAAAAHAVRYLETLDARPIGATASLAELRARLTKPFPETGHDAEHVIHELVRDAEGGILGSANGRFFGWVIGGTLPVALAADWLTSAWDQNAASNLTAPAEAVVEEIAGSWLRQLFGLPHHASFAFVTGSQMAHATALAAARHRLLRDRNWDAEEMGLAGAPPLRILVTENRHESILRAVRLLGMGTRAVTYVASDEAGRMDIRALAGALHQSSDVATIVCLQAGDLNTAVFDHFDEICPLAKSANAWVHVDGAFGLWVASSQKYRRFLDGARIRRTHGSQMGISGSTCRSTLGSYSWPTPSHTEIPSRRLPAILSPSRNYAIRRIGTRSGRVAAAGLQLTLRSAT